MGTSQRLYEIHEVLGTGSFGSVYRAELYGSAGFRKSLALKLLHPDRASSPDILRRLRDEARLLAHVNHPGIVQVFDLVRLEERWTVIMEHVPGASLRELIGLGSVPVICAVQIVERIAEALDAAHHARDGKTPLNLVHRDIKPSNVLITADGSVKLVDFGVALANADVREANTDELFFGAPEYMAPERWHFTDTPAADVYALGAVLYELITGELLGRTSTSLAKHCDLMDDASHRLRELDSDELRALVQRMLAYQPEERPSPREVALACKQLIPSLPGPWLRDWSEREVTRALALRIPVHNDPLVGTLLAETSDDELTAMLPQQPSRVQTGMRIGLLALVALFAGLAWWAVRATSQPDSSTAAADEANTTDSPAPASEAAAPAASMPATLPPEPPATGSVHTTGDARQVFLLRDGRRHSPGTLPVGTYDIEAHFSEGWVLVGQVELLANSDITIDCDSKLALCRLD